MICLNNIHLWSLTWSALEQTKNTSRLTLWQDILGKKNRSSLWFDFMRSETMLCTWSACKRFKFHVSPSSCWQGWHEAFEDVRFFRTPRKQQIIYLHLTWQTCFFDPIGFINRKKKAKRSMVAANRKYIMRMQIPLVVIQNKRFIHLLMRMDPHEVMHPDHQCTTLHAYACCGNNNTAEDKRNSRGHAMYTNFYIYIKKGICNLRTAPHDKQDCSKTQCITYFLNIRLCSIRCNKTPCLLYQVTCE